MLVPPIALLGLLITNAHGCLPFARGEVMTIIQSCKLIKQLFSIHKLIYTQENNRIPEPESDQDPPKGGRAG